MEKSTKAALFSALIFPGAGLFWLKHYWRAALFMVPAIAAAWYIFTCMQYVSNVLTKRITEGSIYIDILNINQAITQISAESQKIIAAQHFHMDAAQWAFIAAWICSIVSSYFAGKKLELTKQSLTP